jgi:Slime mold cyclic AMP receptor
MIPHWQQYGLCEAQALILNFSCLSSVLWTSVIAFTIYRSVVLEKKDGWKYELYYLLYAFGVPLSLNFLPFLTDSFGEAEGWCWITIEGGTLTFLGGNVWRIINYLAPLWLVIFFNFVMYWRTLKKIRTMIDNVTDEDLKKNMLYNRLKLYPYMLLMCHLPVTVHRVLGFFDMFEERDVWLSSLLASFFLILSGFLNAVVYGLTDRVKESLQKIMYATSSDTSDISFIESSESEGNPRGSTNTI